MTSSKTYTNQQQQQQQNQSYTQVRLSVPSRCASPVVH